MSENCFALHPKGVGNTVIDEKSIFYYPIKYSVYLTCRFFTDSSFKAVSVKINNNGTGVSV